jgi:phosphatidylserine decarboxylase
LRHYPHPILAKEGWNYIIISCLVALLVLLYNFYVAIPFIIIALFILQFFRDPVRVIPNDSNIILSPADGRVIAIAKDIDPYQNVQAIKISIFMNVFNVHSNRSPVDGNILNIIYNKGKFINADFDKASTENERNAMIIELNNKDKITVVQVAGLIARRILCYSKIGQHLKRGQRYGFIRFGSRVDLYLPLNYKPCITIGQKVKASSDIICHIEK